MDPVLQCLANYQWNYANGDPAAIRELGKRIRAIGETPDKFITYSELVKDVTFHLANVNDGEPFQIHDWTILDRAIIGSFLGRIAAESYEKGKFFASSLVIGIESNQPGEGFFNLAQEVGLLPSNNEEARLLLWFEHVKIARAWYSKQKNKP